MVAISTKIDKDLLADINKGLENLQHQAVSIQNNGVRMLGLAICDSLRKVTPISPDNIKKRPEEFKAEVANVDPPYLTYKPNPKGKYKRPGILHPIQLHRWVLEKNRADENARKELYYVYSHIKHIGKRGKVKPNLVAEKKELLQFHGGIQNQGLAKQSWNWAKGAIWGQNKTPVLFNWRKTASKKNKRDPKKEVQVISFAATTHSRKAAIEITNKLDYIEKVVPDNKVEQSIRAAYSGWAWRIQQILNTPIFDSKGWPIFKCDWNALEKRINPEGYERAK